MLTEYQSFLAKVVYLLGYNDIFFKRCLVLDGTTDHKIKQTSSRMDVLFLTSKFRSYSGWNCNLNTMVLVKNQFLSACFRGDDRLFFTWDGPKSCICCNHWFLGTSTWTLYFATPKYFDYMQYYMMLLEQCNHIVVKPQATVTCLAEDQIHAYLVTLLGRSFAFSEERKTAFHFQLRRFLKHYVWHCTRYWACR